MIINETIRLLEQKYPAFLTGITIEDVRIGVHITAVRLSDGSCGLSSTMEEEGPFRPKSNRHFTNFSPLKIRGSRISDLLAPETQRPLIESLKMAVINAISSNIIASGSCKIVEDADPVNLVDFGSKKEVALVGAFQSYIKLIEASGCKLHILEFNEAALWPDQKKYFARAADFNKVLPEADVVIITGQTLLNNTIDHLLKETRPGSTVIVTGPSSLLLPDILFAKNVSMIGSIKITRPDLLLDIVAEGGAVYHLFEYCAKKITLQRHDETQA